MSKKHNKPNKPKWDEKLMSQLLSEPEVAPHVENLAPENLEFFKWMLYKEGTYQRYVVEQQKKQIKSAIEGA